MTCKGRARGENADVSEGGRRRCTESVTCRGQSDIQLIISGNCPARGVLSACESTLVVIRSGRVAERAGWQEGRRGAPCVEPKRRATTGVAASRRSTSLVDHRGRELGGGSRLGSAEAAAATGGGGRQVTEGFSRAGFSREETDSDWDSQATVLDEDPDEGDADDQSTQHSYEFIHES